MPRCQYCAQIFDYCEEIWGEWVCVICETALAHALGADHVLERFIATDMTWVNDRPVRIYFAICTGCEQHAEAAEHRNGALACAHLENWKVETIGGAQYIYCPACQVKRHEGLEC